MARVSKIIELDPEQRKQVDRKLVAGHSLASISRLYNVSEAAVQHYRDTYLGAQLLGAGKRSLRMHSENLLQDMTDIMQASKDILQSAQQDQHRGLSLKAIKEIRLNIETTGKILFAMGQAEAQGMTPEEVQEFKRWKEDKDSFGAKLRSLPKEDIKEIQEIALKQLSGAHPRVHDIQIIEEVPEAPTRMRRSTPRKPKDT